MLLEKERDRLLQILQSRTASHGEKRRAREMLESGMFSEKQPVAGESIGASSALTHSAQNGRSAPVSSD
jgi:hypothetical protein